MRRIRIYQEHSITEGVVIELSPENHHYLTQVMRVKDHTNITLTNGQGVEGDGDLHIIDRRQSSLTIHCVRSRSTESPIHTTLIQGLSKGEKMDFTIQKAVELGANRIIPVITDHSVIKLDEKRQQKKREHWQSVANTAMIQCGRTFITQIDPIIKLDHLLSQSPLTVDEIGIVLEPTGSVPITKILKSSRYKLIVGPEGGLSDREIALLQQYNYVTTTIGARILRTETAALTALSVLQSLWGDF